MNDRTFTYAHYERLQRRLRQLVDAIDDQMRPADRAFVNELIVANECGVALETIVGAIVEDRVDLDGALVREIADLATTMQLSPKLAVRLTPAAAR